MKAFVVDTNVGAVANGKAQHAGPDCVSACVEALAAIRAQGMIVLDDARRILREYQRHMSPSGQPGVGDLFMEWVWQNQANPERCERVRITPRTVNPDDFEEFPDDPDLKGFDVDDRKFVAVALASRHDPTVLNAVDTGWQVYNNPLRKHGVRIQFLCPELMKVRT